MSYHDTMPILQLSPMIEMGGLVIVEAVWKTRDDSYKFTMVVPTG